MKHINSVNKQFMLLIFVMGALCAMACAEDSSKTNANSVQSYSVTGVVPKEVKKVYMRHVFANKIDTILVANGEFCFSGEVADEYIFGEVFSDRSKYGALVVLDGNVAVDLEKHEAKGTAENETLTPWAKRELALDTRMDSINDVISTMDDAQLRSLTDQIVNDKEMLAVECCKANTQCKFPALFLTAVVGSYTVNKDKIIEVVELDNAAYMQIKLADRVRQEVAAWKK